MTERDDFEHRLGRGLRRWAESGKPGMDLEAYIKLRVTEPGAPTVQAPQPTTQPGYARSPRRRWLRWTAGFAAAAALVLALTATFPSWAGAAAGWPLVGPAVTEIILKDAGLKWAYENGLIHGTLAEARDGDVTVRILGAMADSRQTTVIYQIIGLPTTDSSEKALRAGFEPPPPLAPSRPEVSISKVSGQGGASWSGAPVRTPVGLVGTASTLPLSADAAELMVTVQFGAKKVELPVQVSRAEADKFSREVAVNRSQEIDGMQITVESVTYTPAETIIRYREEGPSFYAPVNRDPQTEVDYIESNGKHYQATGNSGVSINGVSIVAYPPVKGPITFVIPVRIKGVDANLVWPLHTGATQQVRDIPIALTGLSQTDDQVTFEWMSDVDEHFVGIANFALLDAAGQSYPLGDSWSSQSNYLNPEGKLYRRFNAPLPPGVTPVAVWATKIGHKVTGPWRFELPR